HPREDVLPAVARLPAGDANADAPPRGLPTLQHLAQPLCALEHVALSAAGQDRRESPPAVPADGLRLTNDCSLQRAGGRLKRKVAGRVAFAPVDLGELGQLDD